MKFLPGHKNNNLTELEVFGLSAKYNLADGHSYISAKEHFGSVLSELPELWGSAVEMPIPEMEVLFKNKFAEYFALDGLRRHSHFSVCPTASNSIDIVGAWARSKNYKVGLVEPTFDNLAQLLRRREVALEAIPEKVVVDPALLEDLVRDRRLDALFLVNPNNPTGVALDAIAMSNVIDLCHRHDVILILDTSFRFCHQTNIDEYALLSDKGVSFIVLEDTGKQWPTLDTKASLLSYSEDLAADIRNIYEEIYLCCSNFSLRVIVAFIDETLKKGGLSYMHSIVMKNIEIARSELENSLVAIETVGPSSIMTVMWLNIEKTGLSDLELTDYLAKCDVAVLPGRYFYWNSHQVAGHNRIRIALMKPDGQFLSSILRLKQALIELALISACKNKCLAEVL
ncbi:UNVERIFIED_ORG: aspartate/methionine/tyrosine aminotransferase [Pseudomonas lini]|uniref:Aminotransferase class I/II-fold pyridoxal phosphate-dependent enzyme n=1 Tax=Pseudomonas viciae TaxID=2505979 RepID=A0ABY8PF53_9PSED|nr:aminotransferase class I/II-fold pyridoxal phosphate-dependent enzyme [Pseudomonas viciae]UZE86872.1 aminotransferase class I/II-fold pyridoxal phosphate-dependent enzyme [Pseudomonas viciae]WGO93828.1 aminotransferase class I/II-fold pyridoxal phosphate-dependent enzyme [Pseudomonas viciae]